MKKEFAEFNEAINLKEIGFIQAGCYAEYRQWDGRTPWLNIYQDWSPEDSEQYTKECEAPLYQQAFRWFREKHKLQTEIYYQDDLLKNGYKITDIKTNTELTEFKFKGNYLEEGGYEYEEAELACLKKLIEIVKEKK